jgi:type I restriction enzyme S subunit
MDGLNMSIIKAMPIPIPPLNLQQEFAAQVAIVRKLKAYNRASLEAMNVLFESIQQRAFRGDLWQPSRSPETQWSGGGAFDNSSH